VKLPILTIRIRSEQDVVTARRRARQLAEWLKFDTQDQVRIATAVSEIARNAHMYAGGGLVEYSLVKGSPAALSIRVADVGPGIRHLNSILGGNYGSSTGMGRGIAGSRRLMDQFEIETAEGKGTSVTLVKYLSAAAPEPSAEDLREIAIRLTPATEGVYEEIRNQNQELLDALDDLRRANATLAQRQEDLQRLNLELEETNRGVVALYAELDERAERLRTADTMKSRFLSYMSHEFRTPLNGIIGLTRLMLDRPSVRDDAEAVKQVGFVKHAAEELTELVNDLLDLAKAEAGKLVVHPGEFEAAELLGTVRGMFRPLQPGEAVALIFEPVNGVPLLNTDETKLAQILRNLVSNALKFTERGEVRVRAAYHSGSDEVVFAVADTGVGIPEQFHQFIFDEFSQIEHPLQKKNKGTGLGLPLCRRLAELLGGRVKLSSRPGFGSTFEVTIPRVCREARESGTKRILVIDDEEIARYILRSLLPDGYEVTEAAGGYEGLRLAQELQPDLIFLDLAMPDLTGFEVLRRMQDQAETRNIPVVIATGHEMTEKQRASTSGVIGVLRKDVLARAGSLVIDLGEQPSVTVKHR
jgi:signal transduction histidine kinase/anti-sigma regulatory factor (Ser/Thr protein kinase)